MLYSPRHDNAITITRRNLAHGHRTAIELAFVGADLLLNRKPLVSPTLAQTSGLAKVSRQYIRAAAIIADNDDLRADVLAGRVSLWEATMARKDLAELMLAATREELQAAARTIGPDHLWDAMIAPVLS